MGMLLEMAKAGSLQNVSPEVIEKLMALDAKGAGMSRIGEIPF